MPLCTFFMVSFRLVVVEMRLAKRWDGGQEGNAVMQLRVSMGVWACRMAVRPHG
jgi:hypothetical protein